MVFDFQCACFVLAKDKGSDKKALKTQRVTQGYNKSVFFLWCLNVWSGFNEQNIHQEQKTAQKQVSER